MANTNKVEARFVGLVFNRLEVLGVVEPYLVVAEGGYGQNEENGEDHDAHDEGDYPKLFRHIYNSLT